ncbi:MAG TPA: non-heme iron oxygenase ferredoxin subunit [Nitrososphaera sp.]|jgi:nitrite reductase/ring-hydroxylating ferredoxin subunit|nr:non-heme iron oxygenase ferredoxin subunit [Nitrososphaera sp.]HKX82168.1 non-heme iron oxygenase ferredoxin subunit [Nitrososphaera sp.]
MEDWIRVCDSKSLKDGEMLDFDHGDSKILLAKSGGNVYATDRICTHAYADLSTGILNEEENTVTCPLHLSSFKLESGIPQNLPAEQPLKTYKVKIQENAIYIKLG